MDASSSSSTTPAAIPDSGSSLMSLIRDIPTLKGENYTEWQKKIDLAFVLAEVDWILTDPRPIVLEEPVRADGETDAAWEKRQRDFAPKQMSHDLARVKWEKTNKKCCAVIKNTVDPAILGSITDCDTDTHYMERLKSQFTGSSKTYATQLIKQLVTENYTGGGIREHILKMNTLAAKLKPMNLTPPPEFLIHLIFASLPKEFETFVVNYNLQPET